VFVKQLPDRTNWTAGQNCLWDREQMLFDSTTIGQW
jgi:hypothetical protein